MSASPCPAALPLPAPQRRVKPAKPEQLKLPGSSVELVVVAVVIAGVRVEVSDGRGGYSARTYAQVAMKLGGTCIFATAVAS